MVNLVLNRDMPFMLFVEIVYILDVVSYFSTSFNNVSAVFESYIDSLFFVPIVQKQFGYGETRAYECYQESGRFFVISHSINLCADFPLLVSLFVHVIPIFKMNTPRQFSSEDQVFSRVVSKEQIRSGYCEIFSKLS